MHMQIINVCKIQNTAAKFLEYDIIFTRSTTSLTILEIKPIPRAKKKRKENLGANVTTFQGEILREW